MKAIILTCDKYIQIANLVLHTYQNLWPNNPFVFKVPYNNQYPELLKEKYGNKIELIKTKKEIKHTMQALLKGIPDDEWVWWCMDDKYLIKIDTEEANKAYQFVKNLTTPEIGGIMITRNNNVDKELILDNRLVTSQGQVFIQKRSYHNFYQHYFIKSRILKRVFLKNDFSDNYKLSTRDNVDKIIGLFDEPEKATEPDEKMYIPQKNMAILGESLYEGKLTKNCKNALLQHNLDLPNIEQSDFSWILDK